MLFDHSLSVRTPCTLNAMRNCRWSCRFSPTPANSCTSVIACSASNGPGPIPDNCSNCGELIAPDARIVSHEASAKYVSLLRINSIPTACCLPSISLKRIFVACTLVSTVKFGLDITCRKNPLDAFHRTPVRWLTWKRAEPKLSPPLKSNTLGIPHCVAASRHALRISHSSRCSSTRHSPPAP